MPKNSYHRHRKRSTRNTPADLAAAVEEIRGDNVSGAQAITRRAAALVEDWLAGVSSEAGDAEGARRARRDIEDRLRELAAALIDAHPAMAPLYNLFASLLPCLDETPPGEDACARLARTAAAFLEGMDEHNQAIACHFSEVIDKDAAIFTHSAGSTVRAALLYCGQAGRAITVHCTESRPVCEGTVLAQDLARAGIATTLTTDSLAFSLLRHARDPVLAAGADAITAEGVINKAGTLGLATAARSWGIPFYVLAGSEKFLPAASPGALQQERPATEILARAAAGLRVVNRYFDLTPLDCVTGIITERGILTAREATSELAGMEIHSRLTDAARRV